jgi:plastocyanin
MAKKNLWILAITLQLIIAATMFVATGTKARGEAAESASAADVKIDNFSFGPQTLTVAVGTTVTWTNRDDIPHTIVSTDGVFKSKVRDTDEKFSYTFTKAGEYNYFCSVHPKMTGKIVVQ